MTSAIQLDSNTPREIRVIEDYYGGTLEDSALRTLERNGAVFSGTGSAAADTAAIQELIDEYQGMSGATARKARVILPHASLIGTYRIYLNAGLTFDVSKCGGLEGNGCWLDWSNCADGTDYFTITGSAGSSTSLYSQEACHFRNFRVTGNGQGGTSRAFVMTPGAALAGPSYVKFNLIYVDNVGTVWEIGANTYMNKWQWVHMLYCGLGFNMPSKGNSGEAMLCEMCSFSNGTRLLTLDDPETSFSWIGGSVDFNSSPIVVASAGKITFCNSNIEGTSITNPWFDLNAGSNGVLRLSECEFVQNTGTPHAMPSLIDCTSNWIVHIDKPFMTGFSNTDGVLVTGAGRVFLNGYRAYGTETRPGMLHKDNTAANCLSDGDFESAAVNETDPLLTSLADLWTITNDGTVPILHRFAGDAVDILVTNDLAAVGTNCLAAKMRWGATSRRIGVYNRVQPGGMYVIQFQHRKSAGSGTISIRASWCVDVHLGRMQIGAVNFAWDIPNLASGAVATSSAVTVTNARIGDRVSVFPRYPGGSAYNLAGVIITGEVTDDDEVTLFAQNQSAGALDLNIGVCIVVERGVHDLVQGVGQQTAFYTSAAFTPSDAAWSLVMLPGPDQSPWRAPDWARALLIEWDMSGIDNDGGYMYFDDVWVQMFSGR